MTETTHRITPIILAGGKGTRLWPMSRAARPKQFLSLTSELSLFQKTLRRLSDKELFTAPVVITNNEYRFLVAEQAQEVGVELGAILLEPMARNTAPAVVAASMLAAQNDENQLVYVVTSDHAIEDDAAYKTAVLNAIETAKAGRLATFGITPTEPATGFGYIEAGKQGKNGACPVSQFVEKPDAERAQKYIDSGNFYWNSGMFLFDTSVFLAECERLAPEVYAATEQAVKLAKTDLDFVRLDEKTFGNAPSISVDYAIFEKTDLASVIPSPIQWTDLGSWDAVWKTGAQDEAGNLQYGKTDLTNTKSSLVISEKLHVSVDGLDDVAVIASEDAIYVGRLSNAQNVGAVVKKLAADPKTASLTEDHLTSYRPWGGYSSILNGERFQVKRLFVKPGKRLSLQKHHHRSEHWVVVRGTAEVQIGEKTQTLRENESVYIPQGEVHRLTNPGKILLELVEVQTGSYLGEDDIIRIEDEFGRT